MGIIDFISQPWAWYVAGPMIVLVMGLLLFFGKEFGISANFRIMCAADGAGNFADFFKFDWRQQGWNLLVALGAVGGGYLAAQLLTPGGEQLAHISDATLMELEKLGLSYSKDTVPLVPEFISWTALGTWQGWLMIVGGGLMVGFGARYAGGCTSGHAISGMSALQLGSFYAVLGFFAGGLFMVHVLFPLLF